MILCVLALILSGCNKDTPVATFTSADGIWTYKTPDNSISVDFELKTTGGVLSIVNPATITVGGTLGVAATQISGVALPAIDQIRVNANDAGLVQPYYITFITCEVNSAFTQISVEDIEYTYPWGTLKTLTNATITRK